MFIGTSIGGILALCLSVNISINDINDLFLEISNKVFVNKKSLVR